MRGQTVEKQAHAPLVFEGFLLEVDYLTSDERALIRLTIKDSTGKAHEVFDPSFRPYFYFVPRDAMSIEEMLAIRAFDGQEKLNATEVVPERRGIFGKDVDSYRIYTKLPMQVPKLSEAFALHGERYEYDIPFAKRYLIDKELTPLSYYKFTLEPSGGLLALKAAEPARAGEPADSALNVLCFDIEVYNPKTITVPDRDPVIMLSYTYTSGGKTGSGVITYKKIDRPFIKLVKDEKALFKAFMDLVSELDIDVVTGYNSANYDVKYMLDRAKKLNIKFSLSRFEGETKIERHGLLDKVKIAGRVHVDMYNVVKFISTVGAAEYILKLNSYTLKNVYEAVTKEKKTNVDKKDIYKMWDSDGEELAELADYNLSDSYALNKVYDTFVPIMTALTRVTGNVLSDVSVSTTGQLVEFMLMKYAHEFDELIPNKPSEREMRSRETNPIEGAYVKTPEPGIYTNLVLFDFRGLYPSIIISQNIDPSSICTDCKEYNESPTGTRFSKTRRSIVPTSLKLLVDERAKVKQLYKKDKSNIYLGSRSQALKITSNSFFGYMGYVRSRWYSRECAASITAWGRQFIHKAIDEAEAHGFKVIYGDTDSLVMLLMGKSKDEALAFLKGFNSGLPGNMELELEDFYTRGVFVGKKTEKGYTGAKKKYALISESGYIKIRGFELVRRDWSRIARDTQRMVLDAILKEGSADKAVAIVKDVVGRLQAGSVPLSELAISTQLRKGIDGYDSKSPELAAAKKAVEKGLKSRGDVEHAVISYVITRHGDSISDRAELEEYAQDYDPDYYINHQVIPATMRILKELGLSEDEVKGLGKQKKL